MTSTIREAVDPIKAVRKALKYARSISPTAETTLLYDDSLARLHALENAPANNGRSLMTEVLNLVEVCCNCLELSGNDDLKRRVTEFLSAEQPSTEWVVSLKKYANLYCESYYEYNILDRGGYSREGFINKFSERWTPMVKRFLDAAGVPYVD